MTPADIRQLRRDMGRCQHDFAQLLKTCERSVRRYEKGDGIPLRIVQEQLRKLWLLTYGEEYKECP